MYASCVIHLALKVVLLCILSQMLLDNALSAELVFSTIMKYIKYTSLTHSLFGMLIAKTQASALLTRLYWL